MSLTFGETRGSGRELRMPQRTSGFTLLEIITVLFIVGMTSAIVGPRLPAMRDRLEYTINRETLEENLGGLTYIAFRDNRDFVLKGAFDSNGPITRQQNPDVESRRSGRFIDSPLAPGAVAELPPVAPIVPKLKIPPDWEVVVDEPIYFFASGYCRGGKIDVIVGSMTYTYRLVAPTCALVVE